MRNIVIGLAAAAGLCAAAPAFAAPAPTANDIPRCAKPIGTAAVINGDQQGWTAFSLAPPQKLIKVFVQKSGCFKLVDRGAGMDAAQAERDLSYGGELQRGSNLGKGQIKAADYVIVAEVAAENSNAGGGAVGAALGGLVGGRFGAMAGGLNMRKMTATGILSLTNVRTSETEVVAEGEASKTNLGFGAGGFYGLGGAVGGGYDNTESGKVVTQAFLNAYLQMVTQMGGVSASAAADAPKKAYMASTGAPLRKYPVDSAASLRTLPPGAMVYPTGQKDGMYWEVTDENDNGGWVRNDLLQPAQ